MPDISMCLGEDCPKRNDCYRYRAVPSPHRQSYFMNSPVKRDECSYFWQIGLEETNIRTIEEMNEIQRQIEAKRAEEETEE